ncbi:hypothetical protein [Oxalobacter formigenes]
MIIPNKHNGYSPDGRRLYFKGGSSSAAKEANRMEQERQARITASINAINDIFDPKAYKQGTNAATAFDPNKTYYNKDGSVFDGRKKFNVNSSSGNAFNQIVGNIVDQVGQTSGSASAWDMDKINKAIANGELFTGVETVKPENTREKLYDEQQQAVYDLNAKAVKDQYGDAERANRFALARNGLLGGSSNIESNALLQEKNNEGLIQAQALGQQSASALRTSDEQAKQSLIATAQSGIDTGTAQQMAAAQLNSNAQSALGQRGGATIGSLFDNLGQAYLTRQLLQASNNGYNLYNNQYGNSSARNRGDQGSVN